MQDHLREIDGTLARKKERQNTILYKLAKKRQEEERLAQYGLQVRPSNPSEVSDVRAAEFILVEVKRELGDKIAQLRNSQLVSIEKDGEAGVRRKNDEANRLLWKKEQWEQRIAELKEGGESAASTQKHHHPQKVARGAKRFFGCARSLPEAQESKSATHDGAGKRTRDDSGAPDGTDDLDAHIEEEEAQLDQKDDEHAEKDEDDEEEEDEYGFSRGLSANTYMELLHRMTNKRASQDGEEEALRREEARAEEAYRKASNDAGSVPRAGQQSSASLSLIDNYVCDFLGSGKVQLLSEEQYKTIALAKRKASLLSQLTNMAQK